LTNSEHPDVQTAGRKLDSLRTLRNRADYDFEVSYDRRDAATQVHWARDIIQVLLAAELEPVKTQVTEAIKVYERDVLKVVTWHR